MINIVKNIKSKKYFLVKEIHLGMDIYVINYKSIRESIESKNSIKWVKFIKKY